MSIAIILFLSVSLINVLAIIYFKIQNQKIIELFKIANYTSLCSIENHKYGLQIYEEILNGEYKSVLPCDELKFNQNLHEISKKAAVILAKIDTTIFLLKNIKSNQSQNDLEQIVFKTKYRNLLFEIILFQDSLTYKFVNKKYQQKLFEKFAKLYKSASFLSEFDYDELELALNLFFLNQLKIQILLFQDYISSYIFSTVSIDELLYDFKQINLIEIPKSEYSIKSDFYESEIYLGTPISYIGDSSFLILEVKNLTNKLYFNQIDTIRFKSKIAGRNITFKPNVRGKYSLLYQFHTPCSYISSFKDFEIYKGEINFEVK